MIANSDIDVIIIGAGISGLYTAYLLKKKGFKIKIIEASDRLLGRIYTLSDFDKKPIELGAEFIHGKNSILYDLVCQQNKPPKTDYSKYYFYKNRLLNFKDFQNKKKAKEVLKFWTNFWKYQDEEVVLKTYLENRNLYTRDFQNIIEGFFSEYGTTTDKLELKALAKEESAWTSGEHNYWISNAYTSVFQTLINEVKDDIIYKTPINFISYFGHKVLLGTKNNQSFYTKKVVLTVPLSLLKTNFICFEPVLPLLKQKAIKAIGMDTGIKIILKFKTSFWKDKHVELFGASFCPLYYTPYHETDNSILIAYLMGKKATFLGQFSDQHIEYLLLKELKTLFFGTEIQLEKSYVLNWGKIPYIQGVYSFAKSNTYINRKILAEPIDNKLFFAGEATHTKGHAATVHGAMETAERVVKEIE